MNLAVGNSFDLNEKICISIEPTKKRKLEYEDVAFPLSKLKFKDRSYGPNNKSASPDHIGEYPSDCRMESQEDSTGTEFDTSACSLKGSHSINDGCNSAITVDVDRTEMSSGESWYPDQYSTSSSSCNNYPFRDAHYSFDRCQSTAVVQGGDTHKSEMGSKPQVYSGDKDDYLEFRQISEPEEDSLLLTNAILSNTFHPSSETDGAGHVDGKHSPRKPTIDQEFEQYFSMLML